MANETIAKRPRITPVGAPAVGPAEHRPANKKPPPEALSSVQLVAATAREAITLLRSEVELARAELTDDIKSEARAAKGLSVAGVCAITGLNLLLVAAVFALAQVMEPWLAALSIAGGVLVIGTIAGIIGWRHVRAPLRRTRQTLKEDLQWVKERTA